MKSNQMIQISPETEKQEMLKTIRVPDQLKNFDKILPKANYEQLRVSSVGKKEYLSHLDRLSLKGDHSNLSIKEPLSGRARRKSNHDFDDLHHSSIKESTPQKYNSVLLDGNEPRNMTKGSKVASSLPSLNARGVNKNFQRHLARLNPKKHLQKYNEAMLLEEYKRKQASPALMLKKGHDLERQRAGAEAQFHRGQASNQSVGIFTLKQLSVPPSKLLNLKGDKANLASDRSNKLQDSKHLLPLKTPLRPD